MVPASSAPTGLFARRLESRCLVYPNLLCFLCSLLFPTSPSVSICVHPWFKQMSSPSQTKYEARVGLEVHVQLRTHSKIFCACPNVYGSAPNTDTCPVCLGYPGALPVLNREAVRLTAMTGMMLGCEINRYSKWDRKNYFYPDMSKNYQISQYDRPLCLGGSLEVLVDREPRVIGITRIHLEEDVGKNTHFTANSGVDFNRAGTPLMELVSEPDMTSADEALAFLTALKQMLAYGGISDCNLEQGNVRCDVNCSVRPVGQTELGVKTEIKNMNTFKGVHRALSYEIQRQKRELTRGGEIVQETRRWDDAAGVTQSMRSKEYAHDYRYFPEPDLVPVVLDEEEIEAWRQALPELPRTRRERFMSQFGLPEHDAGVLSAEKDVADYYEAVVAHTENYKAASNWMMTEMLRAVAERGQEIGEVSVAPEALAALVGLVDGRKVNQPGAKQIFNVMLEKGGDPAALVEEMGLAQVNDAGALEALVDQAIAEHPASVEAYRGGKTSALQHLMGQVMRLSKGKADPRAVNEMLQEKLGEGTE